MKINDKILQLQDSISNKIKIVAVSKTKPIELIQEVYNNGYKIFGENKVQELVTKYEKLPKDIEWHAIGHLQKNKVKYIAPFVYMIHSVDSLKLLNEINKRAKQNERVINCLLQIHIAKEDTKFGLSFSEAEDIFNSTEYKNMQNIKIIGLMGMATNTNNKSIILNEFKGLKSFFEKIKLQYFDNKTEFSEISMGMSSDYKFAIEAGSTIIRVGSIIFGKRN